MSASASSRMFQGRARLTQGSVEGHLARMTAPMIGGIAAMMAVNLADTFFVSRLGTTQLAAMGFVFPVVMTLMSVAIGLGAGTSSVVARAIGGEDDETIRRLATHSMVLSALIAIVLTLVGWLTIDPLFRLLGADQETRLLIASFLRIWYGGLVFFLVPMVAISSVRATGNARAPALVLVAGAVLQLALDPLLIFGGAGIPALGIRGAALAMVLSRAATLPVVWHMLRQEDLLSFRWPGWPAMVESWRRILGVGLPAAATNMIIPAAVATLQPLLARFGKEVVAAFGAGSRVESMALVLFFALSSVIGPFVGQNAGAGRWDRVHRAMRSIFWFCLAAGLLAAGVLWFSRFFVAGWFARDPIVLRTTALYLAVLPLSYGAYGVVMNVNAAFNGLNLPMRAVAISLVRMILLYLPLAWFGSRWWGVRGIFVGAAVANLAAGVFAVWWSLHTIARRRG